MIAEVAAVALGTLLASEPVMTLVHRFAFHGPLWCWHKSHHEHPGAHRLVSNDRLWLGPLLAAATFIVLGAVLGSPTLGGLGLGTGAYIGAYIFAHDGVAHGRFRVPAAFRRMTLFRVVAHTHRLHHRGGRDGVGAAPFGVYAAHLEHRWGLSQRYSPPTKICAPVAASRGA